MNYLVRFLLVLVFVLVADGLLSAQQVEEGQGATGDLVYGRPYRVPAVRVYLTDEETGGPFAGREVCFKYCWGWDVLKKTSETDRMPNTVCREQKGRTDKQGVVVLPTWLLTPSRPVAPEGAEFSDPRFKYAGIIVRDEKHDTYLSVFDAEVNLLDKKGEVRRIVRLYPPAKQPKE